MSNVDLVPRPERGPYTTLAGQPVEKLHANGSICILCQLSQAHGLKHTCITRSDSDLGELLKALDHEAWEDVLQRLAHHPGQPFDIQRGELRPVDWSWCFCSGCSTKRREETTQPR